MMRDLSNSTNDPKEIANKNLHKATHTKLFFLTAAFIIFLVKLGLKLLSFNSFQKLFNVLLKKAGKKSQKNRSLSKVLWAVKMASHYYPMEVTCFERALTAKYLLRHDDEIKLHIGVKHSTNNQLMAHAWLEKFEKRIELTQVEKNENYQTIWIWET